jgi:hypothetical protein
MDVKIGKVDVGLLTPTVAIDDFRVYNTAEFGGSLFLSMPEIYFEYDRDAIRSGKLRFRLVRLNLAEVDLVRDKHGRLNIQALQDQGKTATDALNSQNSPIAFDGIDTFNISFQKLRVSSLDDPSQAQDVSFGLTNQVFHNIKSQADLTGMGVILAARGSAASSQGKSPVDMSKVLQQLLH